jgi:parallel beta-helix repeat protein
VDGDGVPDLISGYAAGQAGVIKVYRGNIKALWPYGETTKPSTFLSDVKEISIPEPPDFLAVGDFDADGHLDIVAAAQGGSVLYFILSDGHGGFTSPQTVRLSGVITAMVGGEMNRPDGLADIAVGVTSGEHSQVLVFESPRGAMRAEPEAFDMPAAVTAMALGRHTGGPFVDLAVAAGNQLLTLHGRDRKLSAVSALSHVEPAEITQQTLPFSVLSLSAGSFSGLSNLAALGDDGAVHLLENSNAVTRLAKAASSTGDFRPTGSGKRAAATSSSRGLTRIQAQASLAAKKAPSARAQSTASQASQPEWSFRESVSLPQSVAGAQRGAARLVSGHLSSSPANDLLVLDGSTRQVHVLVNTKARDAAVRHANSESTVAHEEMSHVTSLDVSSMPAAALTMRVNRHPLESLVLLTTGDSVPVVAEAEPTVTASVTNTSASGGGSLQAALEDIVGASLAEITFNIPLTDSNCDANTHVCTIQPLSPHTGACNGMVMVLDTPATIDGYTQPGASPNTLSSGDDAVVLIRIDGGLATTPGGSGMDIFETAATIRGIDFTGWNNPDYACVYGYSNGGFGVDVDGLGDFLEGNFIGVDATGSNAATNTLGVFVENGPYLGWTSAAGNVIGGTTPQARNIISGNSAGVEIYSRVDLTQIQGNFIGTDASGTKGVGNPYFGILASEQTTIGGTSPGAGNLISANSNGNVMMNASAAGSSNTVQGNLIGTDVTGTKALGGIGVSIIYEYNYATIGGTSPTARNVISGNSGPGIYLDMVWDNTIQGNYIGTDPTATVAVPNTGAGIQSDDATIRWWGSSTPVTVVFPAFMNTIGGTVSGAGNVISGNAKDGISIAGSTQDYNGAAVTGAGIGTPEGNPILGNLIGTDASGANAIPNGGNGIHLLSATDAVYGTTTAMNNVIGNGEDGAANTISNNTGHGIFIEAGSSNQTVGNVIHNNGGAGVRVVSGSDNLISRNSIYGNSALGIDLDAAGVNQNSHCQASVTGANNLQNAPVLTTGTGSTYLSATATDPNGNTSEFSNTVAVSSDVLSALGTFDGLPNTTFTIEFFSSPSADASGYGQGDAYLGSTTVTTPSTCDSNVSASLDTTQADLSVSLISTVEGSASTSFSVGPATGWQTFSSTVVNHGAGTAHSVVWTDQIPSNLSIVNSAQNSCTSPVTTDRGSCSLSGNLITCALGTMAPGDIATISVPVEANAIGTATDTASVSATEPDPNSANNTASASVTISQVMPYLDHLDPANVIAGNGDLTLMVYGSYFQSSTAIQFNGTLVPVTAYFDNQTCYYEASPFRCEAMQVVIPGSMLASAGDALVQATNGTLSSSSTFSGFVQSACTYDLIELGLSVGYYGTVTSIDTDTNAPSCSWGASTSVSWMTVLDNTLASGGSKTGTGTAKLYIAPDADAARTGVYTQAGQSLTFSQTGSAPCTFITDAISATISGAAGSGTINVTASDPVNCFWSATSYSSWISVPSDAIVGNGSMNYTVTANHGAPRTGWVVIANQLYTITQSAADACYFTLSSSSSTVPTSASSGSFDVVASNSSCAWTASVDLPFTTITAGSSGTGSGTITYAAAANTGDGRTATITVGNTLGSYQTFAVNQVSANVCSASLSPSTITIADQGGTGVLALGESYSFCKWAAQSNNSDALVLNASSGTSGTSLGYTVTQNTSSTARVLTATIGCQTFTVNQDAAAVGNPVPIATSLQPSSTPAGTTGFTLTVNGSSFVSGATVLYNGLPRVTTFVSASQITAALLDTDIDTVGTATIAVTNPVPGGGMSTTLQFSITGQNPVPVITALQPSIITVASAQKVTGKAKPAAVGGGGSSTSSTLTITGTGFISSSVVSLGGTARTTTFVSTTQLTVPLLAADVATAASLSVVVTNPSPGGGASNSMPLTVQNPVPVISSITPTTATLGSGTVFLTVYGSNFVSTSVVNLSGVAQPTSYGNSDYLIAMLSNLDTAGALNVTVTNPAPGGGTSSAAQLTVSGSNPVPTLTSVQPTSATAGTGAFTLTVNGTNFVTTSVVNFNGSARATTYVSATQLTAAILASDITLGGAFSVTVTNPTPGGGTTSATSFAVNNPVPSVTSLQPSSIGAGSSAFTLTVNGTGFVSSSTVIFNGNTKATTFVSATQLTASITAADVSTAGSPAVSVTNPTPGGGSATAVSFTITAAQVPQASLSPSSLTFASTTVGSPATAQNVKLSNPGNATLNITSISLTGTNPSDFADSGACGSTLSAGASCNISVTFTPASAGAFSATLSVADNASGSPHTVSLSGSGAAQPDFTLSSTTGAQTVSSGGAASYTISVAASAGTTFSSAVTLSASGLPSGATATFTPTSVTPGSTSATSALVIQTAATTTRTSLDTRTPRLWTLLAYAFTGFVGCVGFVLPRRSRKHLASFLLLILVGVALFASSCGGGFALHPASTSKTYVITVTGTSGTTQHAATVTLIVQ